MISIREKGFTRFLIFNLTVSLILIIGLLYVFNRYFYSYENSITAKTISNVAEINDKENIDIIDGLDYESIDDIQRVIYEIYNRDYLSQTQNENIRKSALYALVFVILITYLILIVANMLVLSYSQRKYIKSVDNFIDSVVEQRFDIVLDESKEGITSKLNMRFNKMGNSINRSINRVTEDNREIKNTLADISHQIKTPLTSLSINNEILSESDELSQEQIEFIKINESQISRLVWLTDSLLKISKLDSNTVNFIKKNILAYDLVKNFNESLLSNLKKKDLKIEFTGDRDLELEVDYDWTREAILNIVKNATEHATSGSTIIINLVNNSMFKGIEIYNEGKQISLNELTRIFDRFYKSINNTNPDSIGIGLNLSKKIIELQEGTISVSNEENGVKFSILFLTA